SQNLELPSREPRRIRTRGAIRSALQALDALRLQLLADDARHRSRAERLEDLQRASPVRFLAAVEKRHRFLVAASAARPGIGRAHTVAIDLHLKRRGNRYVVRVQRAGAPEPEDELASHPFVLATQRHFEARASFAGTRFEISPQPLELRAAGRDDGDT